MQEYVRRKLLEIGHPVLRVMGTIGFPERDVGERFLFEAVKHVIPGDVLLSRKEFEASNILQPNQHYKHAATFAGLNEFGTPFVIEAIGKGVVKTGLAKFLLTKDDVLIVRPTFATPDQMVAAVAWALTLVGQPYDYEFKPANQAWYCSEIPARAYLKVCPDSPFVVRKTLGVDTWVPQDFANAVTKWKPILASKDYPDV